MASNKSPNSGVEQISLNQFLDNEKHKTVGITLDSVEDYHWVWYKGVENLTLKESLIIWGKLTDWVINQSLKAGDDTPAHVYTAFVKKIAEMGTEPDDVQPE